MKLKFPHILIFGLVLRTLPLNQSLWLDEAINVLAARDKSVVDLVTTYSIADFHPPLYHPILHYWIRLFGDSEFVVRLPSLIFGLITIYFTYLISQLIFPKKRLNLWHVTFKTNLLPPLLLSISGLHIYYSGEARMYSLAAMFVSAAFYYLLKINPKPVSKSFVNGFKSDLTFMSFKSQPLNYTFLIFALTGILYSDYVAALTLPVFFIFTPVATLVAVALTIPWWPYLFQQLQLGISQASQFPGWSQVVGAYSLKNLILVPIKFTLGRISFANNFTYAAVLLPVMAVVLALLIISLLKIHKKSNKFLPINLWLIIPLFLAGVLSLKISILSYFRLLFLLPAFYLALTQGLTSLPQKIRHSTIVFLLTVTLFSSLAYITNPQFHRENWRDLATWIQESKTHASVAIFPSLAQTAPFDYYQPGIQAYNSIVEVPTKPDQIYLFRYVQDLFDPADQKRQDIENLGYQLVSEQNFNGVVVWLYVPANKLYAQTFVTR